ncbi:MAG: hypothetical protein ACI392_00775 [Paludibacteraceae bacterium]
MRRYTIYIAFLVAVAFPFGIAAQSISSYKCDFEDETENARWVLNYAKNANIVWKNQWYIGEATAYGGSKSLYISADLGATAGYTVEMANLMVAYRELTLEAGTYNITFEWKALGAELQTTALMVLFVPESEFANITCRSNTNLPEWMSTNMLTLEAGTRLGQSSVWTYATGRFQTDGTPHRLVFLWENTSSGSAANPGACVDNIHIARNNCADPSDLKVETAGVTATLTWQGSFDSYSLRWCKQDGTAQGQKDGIMQSSTQLMLEQGVYDLWLQGVCSGDTSVWYQFPTVLIYDAKCFNYLDLNDQNCSYSVETAANWKENVFTAGKIDKGYASVESYHTVHYRTGEIDMRTLNSYDTRNQPVEPLRTIPDGEIASVRIGNWENKAHVARVSYRYTVDDTNTASVLLLKYAVVLELPTHGLDEQPRFTLDILDADGQPLSSCTTVDFAAQSNMSGWAHTKTGSSSADVSVVWKDWTTVGLNLQEYQGQDIIVVLTVYGCTAEVHYGYAYFTLNCTHGMIEGINCGDYPTTQFKAPEGFLYRWYAVDNPSVTLGTDAVFDVAPDDDTRYKVDVIYPTDAACYFTLDACAIPRYPVADAVWQWTPKDCKNYVTLTSKAYIYERNLITGVEAPTTEPLETHLWRLGDNATSIELNPVYEFPAEGGTLDVSLTVGLCNGLCSDVWTGTITAPAIGDTLININETLCKGSFYDFEGRKIVRDTVITRHAQSVSGCDSTCIFTLTFVESKDSLLDVSVCDGDTYNFNGSVLSKAGTYLDTLPSSLGCDSIVTLRLTVVPTPFVLPTARVCYGDGEMVYTLMSVALHDSVSVRFSAAAHAVGLSDVTVPIYGNEVELHIPLPDSATPANYEASICAYCSACGVTEIPVICTINLPSTIVEMYWDDVLSIQNSSYNGGYELSDFQWYVNGAPIDGATDSYLYAANGFDTDAEYTVTVTCNGEQLEICPFNFNIGTDVPTVTADNVLVSSNVIALGRPVQVQAEGAFTATWFSVAGHKLGYAHLDGPAAVDTPAQKGLYLLVITTNSHKYHYKILIN